LSIAESTARNRKTARRNHRPVQSCQRKGQFDLLFIYLFIYLLLSNTISQYFFGFDFTCKFLHFFFLFSLSIQSTQFNPINKSNQFMTAEGARARAYPGVAAAHSGIERNAETIPG
jgi:hypothetical protein